MFEYKTQIFLHHTDAAGRLFFGHQFFLIHEAFEKFLESRGYAIGTLLDHPELTFPIVHAEADYKAMLSTGDRITIQVVVEKLGETSATFVFTLLKADGTLAGTAKTINVTVNKKTGLKAPLPADWRQKLS